MDQEEFEKFEPKVCLDMTRVAYDEQVSCLHDEIIEYCMVERIIFEVSESI